jgi:hypothetical protein
MKMKTYEINIKELDTFMKLYRLEQQLASHLYQYKQYQELQLKHLEKIKTISLHLANFKNGTYKEWFMGLDEEIKKQIKKARYL